MNTTSYNHSAIGTASKPLLSNLGFKILMAEIKKGNAHAYNETMQKFSLENYQHQLIQSELTKQALQL